MGVYVLDTSAVVKRYVAETGSAWINTLCDPASGNGLHIARITAVEVISALARRHRKGDIDQADFDILVDRFEFDLHTQYQVVEISPALVHEAMMFSKKHGLRGYDAVQLAALFLVHQTLSREQLSLPTLIASDHDLLTAAIAEGFDVDDPNNY